MTRAERDRIKAWIEEIDWDRGLPELVVSQEQEGAFRLFRRAALSALCENPGQERGLVDGASPTPVGHDEPGVETERVEDENCG